MTLHPQPPRLPTLASATARPVKWQAHGILPLDDDGEPVPGEKTGSPSDDMEAAIKTSEAVLQKIRWKISGIVDDDPAENLLEINEFDGSHKDLLVEWDAFHQRYNDWRKTEGGCDRTEVFKALDRSNRSIGELGSKVRNLPQNGYLLPIYILLVDAVDLEQGTVRALRNSWQLFTVDAFKAVDQGQVDVDKLRRQANIALQEFRSRR